MFNPCTSNHTTFRLFHCVFKGTSSGFTLSRSRQLTTSLSSSRTTPTTRTISSLKQERRSSNNCLCPISLASNSKLPEVCEGLKCMNSRSQWIDPTFSMETCFISVFFNRRYYEDDDPFLFDLFRTVREPEVLLPMRHRRSRPELNSLYDVFVCVRNDEREHWKTLCNLVQRDSIEGTGEIIESTKPTPPGSS